MPSTSDKITKQSKGVGLLKCLVYWFKQAVAMVERWFKWFKLVAFVPWAHSAIVLGFLLSRPTES